MLSIAEHISNSDQQKRFETQARLELSFRRIKKLPKFGFVCELKKIELNS